MFALPEPAGRARLAFALMLATMATCCHSAGANVQAFAQAGLNYPPRGFNQPPLSQVLPMTGVPTKRPEPAAGPGSWQPINSINQAAPLQHPTSLADELMMQMRAKAESFPASSSQQVNDVNKHSTNINSVNRGRSSISNARQQLSNLVPSLKALPKVFSGKTNQQENLPRQSLQQYESAPTEYFQNNNEQPHYQREQSSYPSDQLDNSAGSRKKHKSYQDELKKAQEKLELKRRLLDLASKATGHLNAEEEEDDAPLMKFNKLTGQFEQVRPDPEAKKAKERLHKALSAISASKLSPKKLNKFLRSTQEEGDQLWRNDEPQHVDANNYQQQVPYSEDRPEPEGQYSGPSYSVNNYARPNEQEVNGDRFGSDDNLQYTAIRSEDYNGPEVAYQQTYEDPRVQSAPAPTTEMFVPDFEDNERADLIEQVRAGLDDRLNRISDLLYFKPEFLNMLANVNDQSELTPLEGALKNLVLCVSDEQFCRPQMEPQHPQWLSYEEQLISDPLTRLDAGGQIDEIPPPADTYYTEYQYAPEAEFESQPHQRLPTGYSPSSSTGAGAIANAPVTSQVSPDEPDIVEDAQAWHEEQRHEEDERKKKFFHHSSGNAVSYSQTGDGIDGSPVSKKSHKVTSQATFSRIQSSNARSSQQQQQQQPNGSNGAQVNSVHVNPSIRVDSMAPSNLKPPTANSVVGHNDRTVTTGSVAPAPAVPVVARQPAGPMGSNQGRKQAVRQKVAALANAASQGFKMRQ